MKPVIHTVLEVLLVRSQMQAMLVSSGGGDAAKLCMDQMIRMSHPWVAAVTKVEMVHQGLTKVSA